MNTGKPSEQIFEEAFSCYGKRAFVYRLPDTQEVRGRAGKGWVRDQPSDYIVTVEGDMFYAEVKSSSAKTSFPVSQFERGQKNAMRRQSIARGNYWIFIHRLETDEWFRVPAEVFLNLEKKSIKWAELAPYKWSLIHG